MSKEVLEFSVQIDEKFDLNFNWLGGFWGAALKFIGQ
ncbi:phenylalanyl-tRNA synthetase subunit alpha [Pedobacter nototheniae]|nr:MULTISPECIES: phenylalanyl-tRNA synthetase subunit alpha [Pedobacter]